MITDDWLVSTREHMDGEHRIYRFIDGHGLSLINSPKAHSFPYAWEAAVLKGVTDDGDHKGLDYSTLLTSDVEVFHSDEEANEFIQRAADYFCGGNAKAILAAIKARKT